MRAHAHLPGRIMPCSLCPTHGHPIARTSERKRSAGGWYLHIYAGTGPHLRRDRPTFAPGLAHICAGTGPHLRRDLSTSAPGLAHICAGTGPHLRRDWPTSAPGLAARELLGRYTSESKATEPYGGLNNTTARPPSCSHSHSPTCTDGPTYPTVAKMGLSRPRAFVRSTRLLSVSIHASAPHACTHRPTHPPTHTHHHYTFCCAPSNMHATAHDAADYCAYSLAALAHGIMSVQRSEPNGASHEAYLPCAMPHAASHAAWSEPRVTAASRAVQVERRQDLRSALGARLGLGLRWEVRRGRVLLPAV